MGLYWADCWGRGEQEAGDLGRGLVPDIPGSQEARPDPALTAEVPAASVRPRLHREAAQASSAPPPSRGQAASLRPGRGGRAASCRGTAAPCPGDKADAWPRDQDPAYPDLRVDSLRVLACLDGASCTCQPCLDAASGRGPACQGAAGIPGVRDIWAFPDWGHCVGPRDPDVPALMTGERRAGATATAGGTGACWSPAWRGTEESWAPWDFRHRNGGGTCWEDPWALTRASPSAPALRGCLLVPGEWAGCPGPRPCCWVSSRGRERLGRGRSGERPLVTWWTLGRARTEAG